MLFSYPKSKIYIMIQRKQSVYLAVAGLLMIVMYKISIASYLVNDTVYNLFVCHLTHPENSDSTIKVFPMAILPILSSFFSFFALYKFKNRLFQIKLGKINLLILLTLMAVQIIYFLRIALILDTKGMPNFGAIIPVIVIILVLIANKAIKKDEDLIRSADRIR